MTTSTRKAIRTNTRNQYENEIGKHYGTTIRNINTKIQNETSVRQKQHETYIRNINMNKHAKSI